MVEDGWGARTPPRMPRPATTLPHHTPNPGAAFIAINVRMTALRAKYVPSSNNPRRIAEAGVARAAAGGAAAALWAPTWLGVPTHPPLETDLHAVPHPSQVAAVALVICTAFCTVLRSSPCSPLPPPSVLAALEGADGGDQEIYAGLAGTDARGLKFFPRLW